MTLSQIFKFSIPGRSIRCSVIFTFILVNLVGCDNSTSSAAVIEKPALANKISNKSDLDNLASKAFLEIHDRAIAGKWLALKEHQSDHPSRQIDVDVKRYEELIRFLADKLREDTRMVANRTVQTRDLLEERNIHESLLSLLDGMADVARTGVVGSYGSYCQWYLNLRQGQIDHTAAIAKMKSLKK